MRFLLYQGLPRTASGRLRERGIDAVHTAEIGYSAASDAAILVAAREQQRIVVTLDADFHALLALSGANQPSVIRIRTEGLTADAVVDLLLGLIHQCKEDLVAGAVVSIQGNRIRSRRLPLTLHS